MERIHQVVDSMLKTKDMARVMFGAASLWREILASIPYAVRCLCHSTLQATPVQLIFGRDMLLDINFQPNYKEMWLSNKKLINYNNKRENAKRVEYDSEFGHYAYVLRDGNYRKLKGKN